jgi:hypothetical protein
MSRQSRRHPRSQRARRWVCLRTAPERYKARRASEAVGAQGAPGTGSAGDFGAARGIAAAGADKLVTLIGGEAPLLACLVKLGAPSLRCLKGLGGRWRHRARTALCSATWAEGARACDVLDLGATRHWLPADRCAAARFLSDGGCSRVRELRADGFVAHLPPLLDLERISSLDLVASLTTNPCSDAQLIGGPMRPAADASDLLAAQSEFCALIALWVLGSSPCVREAQLSALSYSGLLPLRHALSPVVEKASRRLLTTLTVSHAALPVRDLVGTPPPPPPRGGAAPARAAPAAHVDLKWQRIGSLDATLIAALLRANRSLTSLDMAWNSELTSAGSDGARELAEALADSRVLTELDLSETSLGDRCASAMCRAVESNPSLTRLRLRSCGLSGAAREAIEQAHARRADRLGASASSLELQL